jgi:hypothetical protein
MRQVLILVPCLCLLTLAYAGCGRKPSTEFDDRPPIPTAPLAEPPVREAAMGTGGHTPSGHQSGEDLRAPRPADGTVDDASLPARGPSTTYTYVPVPSPRELPGEKVPAASPLPGPMQKLQSIDPGKLAPGTPVTVAPPPPSGAPVVAPAPGDPAKGLEP